MTPPNDDKKKPWRAEEVGDIIGDNVWHDEQERLKSNPTSNDDLDKILVTMVYEVMEYDPDIDMLEEDRNAVDIAKAAIQTLINKARIEGYKQGYTAKSIEIMNVIESSWDEQLNKQGME